MMTPEQKIKATLLCEIAHKHKTIISKDNVDQLFEEYKYDLDDLIYEFYMGGGSNRY